ncbi:glycine-rich RNA-binding protein 4, mitochondrial [Sesamum indicum]|uniref:Glycine-rich RNA-binding protein 4, mitochondrial n=1 Tax=Sesamum indicum TaxID=4182 RepID=A0A6I9TZL6_SESIN|nr:glycine-rich RNA-binding protein 4, mitochondrial [Sesamum indicum]
MLIASLQTKAIRPEKMASTTFHHRILPHGFLAPSPQAAAPPVTLSKFETKRRLHSPPAPLLSARSNLPYRLQNCNSHVASCLPSSSTPSFSPPRSRTRLFVSGLSFRTTDESLKNAFKNFGELVEVNLVMDKIANRPRGFAFLRYATEEESKKAIEGMHGKFLDGRVIFVEVAKSRAELRQGSSQNPS